MDRSAAATVLRQELESYAQRSREELTRLIGRVDAYAITGTDGTEYQVEVNALWDVEPGDALRVVFSIDDGGLLSGLRPVVDDFVVAPDGTIEMADQRNDTRDQASP